MITPREKPLCIVDIAVPRDVELAVGAINQVTLFSIDDLKNMIQHNRRGREHAADKAQEMIIQTAENFMRWLTSLDEVATTITVFRQQIEMLCQTELVKFQQQLNKGADPQLVLTQFARAFTNKLLHHPSVQLRQAGFEGRFDLLDLARQLFVVPEAETHSIG